jgi:histidinol-phosphate aminotransferase
VTSPVPVRGDLGLMEGYHSPQVAVDVRLNTNESPYPPPAAWLEALAEAVRTVPFHRYPDREYRELRAGLAELHGVRPDQVFCANGSNEVLQTLLLTYGGPGRRAAMFEPTYALHSHIARITGTEVVVGERRADFSVDPDVARALIEEHAPTIVFVCSPNNPTGTVEPAATIEALLDVEGDHLIVVDEAYGEFAPWSALELVRDDRALVVVRTYSKVWSMAALRLGFAVAPQWVVDELEKVVLPYHLASATQIAGRLALDLGDEMDDRVGSLVAERERVAAELAATDGVTVYPSGANFLLFRPAGDGHERWQQMVDRGVLVRDFSRWPRLDGCLRVTIGTADENDAFLTALRASLQGVER